MVISERTMQMVAALNAGATYKEVAAQFGVGKATTYAALAAVGYPARDKKRMQARRETVAKMFLDGLTHAQIGELTGRSKSWVSENLKDHGVDGDERGSATFAFWKEHLERQGGL